MLMLGVIYSTVIVVNGDVRFERVEAIDMRHMNGKGNRQLIVSKVVQTQVLVRRLFGIIYRFISTGLVD